MQPTLLQVIHEGAGSLRAEGPFASIPEESFKLPAVHFSPSSSLRRATIISFTNV
jgi:hypothetical protein